MTFFILPDHSRGTHLAVKIFPFDTLNLNQYPSPALSLYLKSVNVAWKKETCYWLSIIFAHVSSICIWHSPEGLGTHTLSKKIQKWNGTSIRQLFLKHKIKLMGSALASHPAASGSNLSPIIFFDLNQNIKKITRRTIFNELTSKWEFLHVMENVDNVWTDQKPIFNQLQGGMIIPQIYCPNSMLFSTSLHQILNLLAFRRCSLLITFSMS